MKWWLLKKPLGKKRKKVKVYAFLAAAFLGALLFAGDFLAGDFFAALGF